MDVPKNKHNVSKLHRGFKPLVGLAGQDCKTPQVANVISNLQFISNFLLSV